MTTRADRNDMTRRRKKGHANMHDPEKLAAEVRQSLSLIAMTALTLLASIAFGVFVGRLG